MINNFSNFELVRDMALSLAGVQESTIHGAPSFKCKGKLLACPALHKSAEDDSMVVRVSKDMREQLIAHHPDIYYLTDHYLDYDMVIVRLSKIDSNALLELLENAWQFAQTKQ